MQIWFCPSSGQDSLAASHSARHIQVWALLTSPVHCLFTLNSTCLPPYLACTHAAASIPPVTSAHIFLFSPPTYTQKYMTKHFCFVIRGETMHIVLEVIFVTYHMLSTFPGQWEFYFIFLTNGSWQVELLSQRLCALYISRELPVYPQECTHLYDDQQCINIVYKGSHFSKSSSTLDIINILKIARVVLFHNPNVNLASLPSQKGLQLHGLKCS